MAPSFPPILGLALALPVIAFWFWMLRDMLDNDEIPSKEKDYWIIAFVVLSLFTAAYYYVYVYRLRTKR